MKESPREGPDDRARTPPSRAWSVNTAAVVGVVLNLAVWFGLHVLFGEMREDEGFGMSLDTPVLATIDPAALVLTLAAIVAVFRFKV